MFVLGIPGGISAAVIMGALMIHGLQPGNRLFTHDPHIIYTVMWGFIIANLLMGGIAAVLARTMAYATLVPRGLLVPIIMIFCVTGTFVASGNPWDVWIMWLSASSATSPRSTVFAPAGILLGVILGPIAEQGLRNVLVLSDDNPLPFMFSRWISVLLIVMILAAIYFSLRPKAWEKVEEEAEAAEQRAGQGDEVSRPEEARSRAHPAE